MESYTKSDGDGGGNAAGSCFEWNESQIDRRGKKESASQKKVQVK